ncbi:MAG: PKD domain-containing protein, partial [Chitinophagales bacterium]
MRKRQSKLWTTILFLFTITLFQQNNAQAATIEGASEVCLSDCVTYQITDAFGGSYFWTITGGDQPTATGESITICWESIGAGSLEVLDVAAPINEAITTLDITVNSLPFAEILSPLFPSCAVFDSTFADGTEQLSALECQTACAFSTGNYYSVLDANLSYEWIIEGDVSHVANNNMVDVEWGDAGAGSILLRVTDNTTNCQDSTLICMDILAIPDATIETDLPIPANNTITVCINQPIQLYNNGSDFSTWQWDLGNGTTSTELNPVASFDASGTYTVSLTNNSACYCTNTGTLTIEVIDAIAPEIDCVSTLCAGTSGTYYAVTSCSDFTWTVSSNGTIEDGGQSTDDFITVFWQDGTEGLVELLASSCPGNDCSVPTVAHVPIISPTGDIEGPTLVCKDIGERYTAPFFNGVDYTWSITGNGQIVEGYGTNEIMVEW